MNYHYYYKNLHLSLSSASQDVTKYLPLLLERGLPAALLFDYSSQSSLTLKFVRSLKFGRLPGRYLYSPSSTTPDLYSSVYACLLFFLYGQLSHRQTWADYLNSFQTPTDGLYRDPVLANSLSETADWWGTRHLTIHVLAALTALGSRPNYPLAYIEPFTDRAFLTNYISSLDFTDPNRSDDNAIMNLGVMLQYSRDIFHNRSAGKALELLYAQLDRRLDSSTGLWGRIDISNIATLSRAVQFSYHLLSLYFYDHQPFKYSRKLSTHISILQNQLGGFSHVFNSSACEDIDSIFLLAKLNSVNHLSSLARSFPWVLANQNSDGGFVFQRHTPFMYGHSLLTSNYDESSLFPTWFRSLSLAYLTQSLNIPNQYHLLHCPGLQY